MENLAWSYASSVDVTTICNNVAVKDREAGMHAARQIRQMVKALAAHPEHGGMVEGLAMEFRLWGKGQGSGSYTALYHFERGLVVVLLVRRSDEVGY